jgi:hypothetical protein
MILFALAMATSSPAVPQKLIIVANNSAVAIDYPSLPRCLAAREAAEAEARRRMRDAAAASPDPIITPALRIVAFCIPG